MRAGNSLIAFCRSRTRVYVAEESARQLKEIERRRQVYFGLIEVAGVDVVYGHSSHHPKAIELHKGKLILYLPTVDRSTGCLNQLVMIPFRLKKFRLNRASHDDALWLCTMFNREGKAFGTQFALTENDMLKLVSEFAGNRYQSCSGP